MVEVREGYEVNRMPKLKPGAVTIDLMDGSVHGDLDHCPEEDLLASAQALLSLIGQVNHKGLWGLGKAYDAGCYLYTSDRQYKPPDELHLEADMDTGWKRKFRLIAITSDREGYWHSNWYSRLVGSVQGSRVVPDTEGKPDHYHPLPPPSVPTPQPRSQRAKGVQREEVGQGRLL
ncbi:MAG: hypothetical protein ABID84_04755 [Chloroflexota bacterium]